MYSCRFFKLKFIRKLFYSCYKLSIKQWNGYWSVVFSEYNVCNNKIMNYYIMWKNTIM